MNEKNIQRFVRAGVLVHALNMVVACVLAVVVVALVATLLSGCASMYGDYRCADICAKQGQVVEAYSDNACACRERYAP